MNSFPPSLQLIFGRRSIRTFAPGAVSDSQIRTLLEAAMAAPSAMSRDPWRFVVVRNAGMLRQLAAALPGGGMLNTAAACIVVCGDLEAAFESSPGYLIQDCSASIQNVLLAAHGLGLGGCWVGIYPSDAMIRRVKELLRLPGPVTPVAAIALGLPGEQPPPRTRYQDSSVHQETW